MMRKRKTTQDRAPHVLARLRQRFQAMDPVERLLAETRMRLVEAVDGNLSRDGKTCTLRISSRNKTGPSSMVHAITAQVARAP